MQTHASVAASRACSALPATTRHGVGPQRKVQARALSVPLGETLRSNAPLPRLDLDSAVPLADRFPDGKALVELRPRADVCHLPHPLFLFPVLRQHPPSSKSHAHRAEPQRRAVKPFALASGPVALLHAREPEMERGAQRVGAPPRHDPGDPHAARSVGCGALFPEQQNGSCCFALVPCQTRLSCFAEVIPPPHCFLHRSKCCFHAGSCLALQGSLQRISHTSLHLRLIFPPSKAFFCPFFALPGQMIACLFELGSSFHCQVNPLNPCLQRKRL
eukprot:1547444-Rhodomonas_salina.2